jgi:lysophospholipase L1-like esterase
MSQSVTAVPARFLAIGDSYTIGEGVAVGSRWPDQLVARLHEAGVAIEAAEVLATTGWTTDELLEGIEAARPTPPYAVVSLLIGVNNQYRGRSPENYREEFAALLDRAVGLAEGEVRRVIVLSIPDWGVTPFAAARGVDPVAVASAIDRFNAINRELAGTRGAHWIDVTAMSRENGRLLLVEDGLHPSARHYAMWVDRVLPVASAILAARAN